MSHPLTSEPGKHIQKWILCQAILNYTNLVIRWDPIQFEGSRHHQGYVETDGSIAYLQANTVRQLASLWKYMILLICQDRPADQKYNAFYFILGEQWFKLTARDMRAALVSEVLNRSQTLCPISHPFIFRIYEVPYQLGACLIKKHIKNRASAYSILREMNAI